jgi:hypothetical protein
VPLSFNPRIISAIMTHIEIAVISLLAVIVFLLILCWLSLRDITGEIGSLSFTVHAFIHDYKQLNDFAKKRELHLEGQAGQSYGEWKAKHTEDSN